MPSLGKMLKRLGGARAQKAPITLDELPPNQTNGDRYFRDPQSDITLVISGGEDGAYHFTQNQNPITPPRQVQQQMLAAYQQLPQAYGAAASASGQAQGAQAQGAQAQITLDELQPNQRTGDRYFRDPQSGISLVVHPDGGHHFSQNRQTTLPPPQVQQQMLEAFVQSQPPINLQELQQGRNGDRYFREPQSGISLVVRPDGAHHFSQNRQTISLPPLHQMQMLNAYQQLQRSHAAGPAAPQIDIEQIDTPEWLSGNDYPGAFDVENVDGVYEVTTPNGKSAIMLTFEYDTAGSDPDGFLEAASEAFEAVGANVQMMPPDQVTDGKPSLAVEGNLDDLKAYLERIDRLDHSIGMTNN
jgi:hypothetical protein